MQQLRLPPPPPAACYPSAASKSAPQLVFDGLDAEEESTSLLSNLGYANGKQYTTCVLKTKSILQEGPTCGLVALLMAADALKLNHSYNLTNVLEAAQAKGYTKMGEMFSAASIADLGEDLFRVKAYLLNDLENQVEDLVKYLSTGLPILVPYDCDKNHDPIMKKGEAAHWATLLGFAVGDGSKKDELEGESSSPSVSFKSPPLESCQVESILSLSNIREQLLLFAKQGKSKFMRLWTFDQLCQSNLNLRYARHPTLNSSKDNSRNFHPSEDLSQSLANKAVVLHPLQ